MACLADLINQEEGWVICRVFKKRVATVRRMADSSPCWFDDHGSGAFMPDLDSPRQLGYQHRHHQNMATYHGQQQLYHCKPELEYHHLLPQEAFLQQLPHLESPKPPAYIGQGSSNILSTTGNLLAHDGGASRPSVQQPPMDQSLYMAAAGDTSATDWRLLDKFVASQLFSHGDTNPKEQLFQVENKHEDALDYASTSAGGSGGGESRLWK